MEKPINELSLSQQKSELFGGKNPCTIRLKTAQEYKNDDLNILKQEPLKAELFGISEESINNKIYMDKLECCIM